MTEEIIQHIGIDIFESTQYHLRPPLPPQKEDGFIKGQFLYIKEESTREMLHNGYQAITILELWNYMKKNTDSYMYSYNNDPNISIISNKMNELGYYGHSGFSFGWTMRQLQQIAIHGEDFYMKQYNS